MPRPALLLLLAAAILPAACNRDPAVTVEDASVGLPVIPERPGVAYFTLRSNHMPMRILGVSSPQIGRIELHDSRTVDGVMRMGPLDDTSFGETGEKVFEPGGPHAMLFDIAPTVRAGGTVQMIFDFDNAPDVTVAVPVQATGAAH